MEKTIPTQSAQFSDAQMEIVFSRPLSREDRRAFLAQIGLNPKTAIEKFFQNAITTRIAVFGLKNPLRRIGVASMRELKDTAVLLLGFLPWLLFLFFSGHSMESLERITWVSLAASLTFGFSELRSGFILQWGTLVFFAACAVLVGIFHVVWVAAQMDLLANASLAAIVWGTLFAGQPFALQYARRDLPPERWNDPHLIAGCRFITLVWAALMTASVGVSAYRRTPAPQASERAYFAISLGIIAAGVVFTTLFKRRKRLQRERQAQ